MTDRPTCGSCPPAARAAVGGDVWVCRICKRDQFARDGATPKMKAVMLWLLEKEQRERAKNKTGRPARGEPAGSWWL